VANVAVGNQGAAGINQAVDMVEWCLEMMLASQCTSWSLEQVGDKPVRDIVERVRQRHPSRVAYAVLKLEELGVPQTRERLVAAPPKLLAKLLRKASKDHARTTRDAILNPRGTHVRSGRSTFQVRHRLNRKRGQTKWINAPAGWEHWCRTIDRPAPTVRAQHTHSWVTILDGQAVSHCRMSARDLAALQTFPPNYKWPDRKVDACLQAGNAVPPLLAQRLLESVA